MIDYQSGDPAEILRLYNERGVRYLCIGSFGNAIDDFTHVITVLESRQETEGALLVALWGRMLCYAYQNYEEEALDDLDLFQSYFVLAALPCRESPDFLTNLPILKTNSRKYISVFQHELKTSRTLSLNFHESLNYSDYTYPIAEFANPNERLSPQDCKDRVKCTADIMRLIAAKIPNSSLTAAVNIAISRLEELAIGCCYRSHWTECLNPIIDAYNYMRKCMDKGVSIAPHIISPGR